MLAHKYGCSPEGGGRLLGRLYAIWPIAIYRLQGRSQTVNSLQLITISRSQLLLLSFASSVYCLKINARPLGLGCGLVWLGQEHESWPEPRTSSCFLFVCTFVLLLLISTAQWRDASGCAILTGMLHLKNV